MLIKFKHRYVNITGFYKKGLYNSNQRKHNVRKTRCSLTIFHMYIYFNYINR